MGLRMGYGQLICMWALLQMGEARCMEEMIRRECSKRDMLCCNS